MFDNVPNTPISVITQCVRYFQKKQYFIINNVGHYKVRRHRAIKKQINCKLGIFNFLLFPLSIGLSYFPYVYSYFVLYSHHIKNYFFHHSNIKYKLFPCFLSTSFMNLFLCYGAHVRDEYGIYIP